MRCKTVVQVTSCWWLVGWLVKVGAFFCHVFFCWDFWLIYFNENGKWYDNDDDDEEDYSYYYVLIIIILFFQTRHLGGWFHLGGRLFHNLEHHFQLVDVYDFYKMCPIHGALAPITSQSVVVSNSFLQGFIHQKCRMSSMNSSWISQ